MDAFHRPLSLRAIVDVRDDSIHAAKPVRGDTPSLDIFESGGSS